MSLNEQQLITIAQAYGIKHWLSSPLSGAKRKILEHFWDKYRGHMDVLRDADENMRAVAAGFDNYINNARAAYKQKRYIDVAHWIGQINLGSHRMLQLAKQVVDLKSEHLAEQFGQSTEADHEADYFTAPPAESGGFTSTAAMEIEAGLIGDAISGISGGFLEKMYWKQTQARKIALDLLIKDSSRYVESLKRVLNSMGHARAQGNLGNWIHEAQKIIPMHHKFQTEFKIKYDKNILPLVDAVRKSRPKPEVKPEVKPEPERTAPKAKVDEPFKSRTEPVEQPFKSEVKPQPEVSSEEDDEVLRGRPPNKITDWDELDQVAQVAKKLKEEPTELPPSPSVEEPSAPSVEVPSAPSAEVPKRRGRPPGKKPSVPPSSPEAAPISSAPSTEILPGPTDDKLEALKKLVREQAASPTETSQRRGPGRPRKTPSVPPSALIPNAPEVTAPSALIPDAPEVAAPSAPEASESAKTEPAEKPAEVSTEEAVKFDDSVKRPMILMSFPAGFELKNLPTEQLRQIAMKINGRPVTVQPTPEEKVERFKQNFQRNYDEVRVIPVSVLLGKKEESKAPPSTEVAEPTAEAPKRGPGRPKKVAP